jgi:hypothetical protein
MEISSGLGLLVDANRDPGVVPAVSITSDRLVFLLLYAISQAGAGAAHVGIRRKRIASLDHGFAAANADSGGHDPPGHWQLQRPGIGLPSQVYRWIARLLDSSHYQGVFIYVHAVILARAHGQRPSK